MTNEEAIRILDPATTLEALAEIEYYAGFSGEEATRKAVDDACLVAVEALKRLIPKKPKEYEDKYYCCPTCGNIVLYKWEDYPVVLTPKSEGLPYCLCCGQAIDWSEEE